MHEQNIEQILKSLKKELEPVQENINTQFSKLQFPVVLILGSPRSGTTLLLQYLAASGLFSYPTNLLTRFAYAPYLGGQIQQLLFNEKYGMDGQHKELFNSDLGKSVGSLGINEFYHFWRRFIPVFFPQYISKYDFEKIDFKQIFQELASVESVFNKPFICKGMMLQYNLQDLGKNAKQFLFLRIKRKPVYVMQSIFSARKKYFGNVDIWWSVKPPEYEELRKMDVYHQIAGQVFYSERAIETGLDTIDKELQITISYNDFCEQPLDILYEILKKYNLQESQISNSLPDKFKISDNIKINKKDFDALQNAYQYFETLKIS